VEAVGGFLGVDTGRDAMQYQVQIWVSEVSEWYGWAHSKYDPAVKSEANRAAKEARRYGWKTRVVKVS